MTKRLFIPGPVDVDPDVLSQMCKPMISHRGKEFSELFVDTIDKLKNLMFTENNVFVFTSSSTGLMEAAMRNCVVSRCLCVANGAFGERWYEIAVANEKKADFLEFDWGKAVTPQILDEKLDKEKYDAVAIVHNETSTGVCNQICEISKVVKNHNVLFLVDSTSSMGGVKVEVDKLGIDVCLFASQKALGLPPGLAVCTVSDKAMEKSQQISNKGYYFSFPLSLKYFSRKQTPTTPSIPLIHAMNYKLNKIFDETLENRFQRHEQMGETTRRWVKKNFELFAEDKVASNTLTCVKNTKNVDVESLIVKLWDKGYAISNGYGKFRNKTFRIAHMGDRKISEVEELLITIDDVLSNEKGKTK